MKLHGGPSLARGPEFDTHGLDPGSEYSDLIGTMSVFNCLYFGHYFLNRAETCH